MATRGGQDPGSLAPPSPLAVMLIHWCPPQLREGYHHGGDRLCLFRNPAYVPRASSVHCEINWCPDGFKGLGDCVPLIHPLLTLPCSCLWLSWQILNNSHSEANDAFRGKPLSSLRLCGSQSACSNCSNLLSILLFKKRKEKRKTTKLIFCVGLRELRCSWHIYQSTRNN